MTITIQNITAENKEALSLANDEFFNFGRIIPQFNGTEWSWMLESFPEDRITRDCFPDENYNYEEMADTYIGQAAYVDNKCAGFALYEKGFGKYLYLENLLVPREFRRCGVGSALLEAGMKLAVENGFIGIKLVCQDNNPGAALCYFKNGFTIGGIDCRVYDGTKQEGKTDLILYRKA